MASDQCPKCRSTVRCITLPECDSTGGWDMWHRGQPVSYRAFSPAYLAQIRGPVTNDPVRKAAKMLEFAAHLSSDHPDRYIVQGCDIRALRAARIAALVEAADRVARYFDPTDGGQGCLDEDGKRLAAALAALAKEEA